MTANTDRLQMKNAKSTGCKFKFGKFWQKLKGKSHWLQPSQSTNANRTCSRNPTAPLEKRKGGRKRSYKWGSEGKLRAVQREFPSPISAVTWRAPSLSTVSNFIASEAHNNRTVPSTVGGCGAHNNCERAGDEDVIGCEIAQYHTHPTHPYQSICTIQHPDPPISKNTDPYHSIWDRLKYYSPPPASDSADTRLYHHPSEKLTFNSKA